MLMQTHCGFFSNHILPDLFKEMSILKKDIEFDSLSHGYCVVAIRFQEQCQCSKSLKLVQTITSHPDTALTTLVNLEGAFNSFGMQYTHITVDLQLYQTACLVQWNDPLRWTNVILHPGMMHTLMSFLGCVGTLMKASGVDILISAAFAGITSIVNGNT